MTSRKGLRPCSHGQGRANQPDARRCPASAPNRLMPDLSPNMPLNPGNKWPKTRFDMSTMYRLTLVLLLAIHLVVVFPGLPWIRSWLSSRSDPLRAHHRLCGGFLVVSILLFLVGLPLSFQARSREGFLIIPLGILIFIGLLTKRWDLALQIAKRTRKDQD